MQLEAAKINITYIFLNNPIIFQDYTTRIWKYSGEKWEVAGATAQKRSNYRSVLVKGSKMLFGLENKQF